ncbi:MAG: hypothetical protein ABI333_23510, partial [bacterium]
DSYGCGSCTGPMETSCTNGIDDDGDGLTDCADVDCAGDPSCAPAHDCCAVHSTVGCTDAGIEACVCAVDSFCCNTSWDSACVSEVTSLGCGTCP